MARKHRMTKATLAYRRIRRMIVEGRFSEDRRWSLRKIAAKLGTSVVPVSEAVRRLEQEGLLETRPQSGIRLRRLSPVRLAGLKILRQAIEVQAVRLVARKGTKSGFDRLRRQAGRIRYLVDRGESDRAAYVDYEFHTHIMKMAGCKPLAEAYDQIATLCMVIKGNLDEGWQKLESRGRTNHGQLVDALAGGKPDKAERAIRRHIQAETRP